MDILSILYVCCSLSNFLHLRMYVRIDNRFTDIFMFTNNDLFGEQGVKVKSYVTSILQWSSVE